ncbi:MAG: hypothetical protein MUC35_01295 [Candidatus Margulisbacteria bacterium]|jgi:hypothetical protein|nr:hypothetical protein [Candidatus Margulisiibacteriota bacterium]
MERKLNLINNKGPLVHVAREYGNAARHGYLSQLVRRVVERQRHESGLDVRVVIPFSAGLDLKEIEGLQDKGKYLEGLIDNVPVYVIKDGELGPADHEGIYPPEATALQSYAHFANNFWALVREQVFGHDLLAQMWDHPMGWVCSQRPFDLGRVRTIFTPVEPADYFMSFDQSQIQALSLRSIADMEHFGGRGVSGFMTGLQFADTVTEWYSGFFGDFRREVEQRFPSLASFLVPLMKSGKFEALAASRGWRPKHETDIPKACIDALELAYLHTLFGRSYDFSINVGRLPKTDMGGLLVSITEKNPEDPRAPILADRYRRAQKDLPVIRTSVRYVANYPGQHDAGFRGNCGGVVQMLKQLDHDQALAERQGPILAFLNGGDGERGFVTTLASCVKGELLLGERTIGDLSQDAGALVGRQLPHGGDGWVVIYGCDNFLLPNGEIKLGDHLLSRAEQGVILLGHSEKIAGRRLNEINYLKGLGVFFIDARSGEIVSFVEKMTDPKNKNDFDLPRAQAMLTQHGGESIYKNTFFFAMRRDVAQAWYRGYEQASELTGQPLHETYDLDFSLHFTTAAMTPNKEDWMTLFKTKGKGFAHGDWERLWDHAHRIKQMAGGIGGADIGSGDETWSDIGTIEAFHDRLARLLDRNDDIRSVSRRALGVPEFEAEFQSLTAKVEFANDSHLILRSVFKNGGRIGNNVIVIGSVFEEFADIPDNTYVIGSHVYRLNFKPDDRSPRLIYALHQEATDHPLTVEGNSAHSTTHLISGQKMHGIFPIYLSGKESANGPDGMPIKDQFTGHYLLNGKLTNQPILGMTGISDANLQRRLIDLGTDPETVARPSVKNIKRLTSLSQSDSVARALAKEIRTALFLAGVISADQP